MAFLRLKPQADPPTESDAAQVTGGILPPQKRDSDADQRCSGVAQRQRCWEGPVIL